MRVISGKRKGMRLSNRIDEFTRPTESRIKESIFSVLFQVKPESYVLDLFAGTGAIGIEFLSRGAGKCVFSEYSSENVKCINENLDHTRLEDQAEIYKGDFKRNLLNIARRGYKFDYVFIDPPYNKLDYYYQAIEMLVDNNLLSEETCIILEANEDLDESKFKGLEVDKLKKYGKRKKIYYLRKSNES